jgi:hypothetical protein
LNLPVPYQIAGVRPPVDGSGEAGFDKGGEWMRAASFRGIRRVYRSPFRAM